MDTNLQSYLKIYKNSIEKDTCDKIVTSMNLLEWEQHTYRHETTNNIVSLGDKELSVTHGIVFEHDIIMSAMFNSYKRYITELKFSWFEGWSGYTQVRFNRYDKDTLMAEHCDHIHSLFDGDRRGIPTLTCLIMLNDEFTGGEFVMWEDKIIKVEKGDALVFPSVFLYPHKVLPVTSGVRYSCVTWAW